MIRKGTARFYLDSNAQLEDESNAKYVKRIVSIAKENGIKLSNGAVERMYYKLKSQPNKVEAKTETVPNDYVSNGVFSALDDSGKMMNLDRYCEFYGLPRQDITSYKLVSHTGIPFYNIVFKENILEGVSESDIAEALQGAFKKEYEYKETEHVLKEEAVLKWADLHFGAHIRNLILTKDYDEDILLDGLMQSVETVNNLGFKKVHVHINGDLIESFSGLNHINSWMSMNPDLIGANAVKLCAQLLHKALSKINNLGKVLIVAGNHDRTSKANDEDVKGGAANLISWGLELMGYDVEFHPYITRQKVGNIYHINLHGDKGISKRSTKDIIWDYGEKGAYNFVFEAHLHSIIEKLSASQKDKFKVIKDDAVDHRRMHLPSFFTGNYYSETLNFNSNPGYVIVWQNSKGAPNVLSASA